MELTTALALTAIYEAAQSLGIIDYLKKLPERTIEAICQRLLCVKMIEVT